MLRTSSSQMFVMSHPVVAKDAVHGTGRVAQVTKRTPIWAGGLSTAGGELPA